MKVKKLLASLLAATMLLGMMSFPVFAQDDAGTAQTGTTITLAEFVKAVEESEYNYDGQGVTVEWSPSSACTDNRGAAGHTCLFAPDAAPEADGNNPSRAQSANAQFWLFRDAEDVTVSNVNFKYIPADFTICANSGYRGSFKAADIKNAEFQLQNTGSVRFEGCTFDAVIVSPFGCSESSAFMDCAFENVYNSYVIKDVYTPKLTVSGCTFENCGGGIYLEGTAAKNEIVITNNTFTDMDTEQCAAAGKAGTRGLIQFSVNGDYSNAVIDISGNTSTGDAQVLRQLNPTVTADVVDVKQLEEENSFEGEIFVTGTSLAWGGPEDTTVKVGEGYYKTLAEALTAVYMSSPTELVTIECKPDADVGAMTHGHVADDIHIIGNNATVTGGEHDLEVDTYKYSRATGKQDNVNGTYLDKDITITVDNLNGIAAWGQRNTEHTVNFIFNNCKNMSRAYISGAKGSNNITLNGCTFDSAKYGNNTSVYSNNPGSINITDCVFNDIAAAVNLNNKSDGLQTVNIQNSTFTNCATKTNADKFGYTAFAAPMRFVTSTSSAEIAVNVDGCTVEYINSEISAGNGDILLGDGREGKDSTPNAALNITKTAAEVQIQTPGEPDKTIVKKVQADETLKITMAAAEEIQVRFVPTADAAVYNLELYADGDVINRLTSADLTFLNASTGVGYEVVKSEGSHVNFQSKGADRYLFYFNGMDVADETDTVITLAQVKLNGYGKVDFKIAEADTNVVNATASDDSIVDSFTVGNGLIVNDKANNGVIDTTLAAATQKLTVNVAFPNEIADNGAAYQAMKVSISGGNLSEAITYNLGDGTEGYTFKTVALGGKSYKAYTVEVADTLLQNTTYTVTIVGAGYRTVRYSVNMQEADKELTFWNNVMDEDTVIEKDNAASTAKVAFLAGDIVKDNNINIYDLSAVASYFGTVNDVAAKSDYAKYDLNRDGKIDSKDVAMVLVSWGN